MYTLRLDDKLYEKYARSLEFVDIDISDSVYDVMENFHNMINYELRNIDNIPTKYAINTILEWVDSTVLNTFDYRNFDIENDLITLSETLMDLPDSPLFDPLFELMNRVGVNVPNTKLFNKHEFNLTINSDDIEDALNSLGVTGCVNTSEIESYKTQLELELMKVVKQLNFDDGEVHNKSNSKDKGILKKPNDLDPDLDQYTEMSNFYDRLISGDLKVLEELQGWDIRNIINKATLVNIDQSDTDNDIVKERFYNISVICCKYIMSIIEVESHRVRPDELNDTLVEIAKRLRKYPCRLSVYLCKVIVLGILCYHYGTERFDIKDLEIYIEQYKKLVDNIDLKSNPYGLYLLYQDILDDKFVQDERDTDCCESLNRLYNEESVMDYMSYNSNFRFNSIAESVNESDSTLCCPWNALAEKFEVRRDGSIKVDIKERTTFMNEYAINHRLMKMNLKQKDYEAMKYNLVYNMILVENIEKKVLYNDSISKSSKLYKDGSKARRFALNDINTYLPIIKENDSTFDLNKFYQDVKADKNSIEIDGVAVASGLSKIIKSIL